MVKGDEGRDIVTTVAAVELVFSKVRNRHRVSEGAKARYATRETSWIVSLASASVAPSEKTTT